MPGPKIRITIESGTGNNDVSLSEFTRVVRSSNALLKNAARTALGRKHDCGFFLSGLSRNSPVSIEITPVSRTLPAAAQDITGTLREEGDILVRDNGVRLPNSSFGLWRNLALPYMEDRIGELTMESVDGDSVDGIMKMDKG